MPAIPGGHPFGAALCAVQKAHPCAFCEPRFGSHLPAQFKNKKSASSTANKKREAFCREDFMPAIPGGHPFGAALCAVQKAHPCAFCEPRFGSHLPANFKANKKASSTGQEAFLFALKLVGARGFEPPTTCTPCRYATRLRYAPLEIVSGLLFDARFSVLARPKALRVRPGSDE